MKINLTFEEGVPLGQALVFVATLLHAEHQSPPLFKVAYRFGDLLGIHHRTLAGGHSITVRLDKEKP